MGRKQYKSHVVYGERLAYPRAEAYPVAQAPQAPLASPPPMAYWGPPPVDPRYSGDGRPSPYEMGPAPSRDGPQQAPYQHQPYVPIPLVADIAVTPSGHSGPWYGETAPAASAAPPVAPVAPPSWGPSP